MKTAPKIDKEISELANKGNRKRLRVSQTEIPRLCLEEALKLPQALNDNFAGKPVAPHQLAMAIDISPTSSRWQQLCGAAIAYGLTSGGYGADKISLTDIGKRVVAPTVENDDRAAMVQAALMPRISSEFFTQYNKNKFPQEKIAKNVLENFGVPRERLNASYDIIKNDGEFVGIIVETKTGPFVALDSFETQTRVDNGGQSTNGDSETQTSAIIPDESTPETPEVVAEKTTPQNRRVFIGHGKNTQLLSQLKDILEFGKFDPVIAKDEQSTAVPLPEKVLDEMRSCMAGIMHISAEQELLDVSGQKHQKINSNVLIEIGASMALYGKNFILLVEKGVELPSNLRGLYRSEYEGAKLDMETTMKLLKAINKFN